MGRVYVRVENYDRIKAIKGDYELSGDDPYWVPHGRIQEIQLDGVAWIGDQPVQLVGWRQGDTPASYIKREGEYTPS